MTHHDWPATVDTTVRVFARLIPEEETAAISTQPEASLGPLILGRDLGLSIGNVFPPWLEASSVLVAAGARDPDAASAITRALWFRRQRVRH